MGRRAWVVSGLWVVYAFVLGCHGRFAWASTSLTLAAAVALMVSVLHYLLDVVREKHVRGRFHAYPMWFRRLLRDA